MSITPAHDQAVLRNARHTQLEQAVADNHRQLFDLNAKALGGTVHSAEGLTYTYTRSNGSAVTFPSMTEEAAGAALDAMMDYYRTQQADNVGYWSLDPPSPANIGASLLARGFQPGWQPCWMALDLGTMHTDYTVPDNVQILADNHTSVNRIKDLPYAGNGGALSDALFQAYPERVQRFIAFREGAVIGQCCLFFTTGPDGIAGMYNVGVIPSAQRQGIGKALVVAACRFAAERGYQYVMLNANHMGRPVYEQVGFQFIGYGCTWWLIGWRYITHAATPDMVNLAEAAGKGDLGILERLGTAFTPEELDRPLANGMTLMQVAAHLHQPAAAEWLINHGVACTALDAWDLGWKDRAADILATHPGEADRRYFDWRGTLLHIAAQRDDIALAQLALDAGTDLSIQDKDHDATPLGWAHYFNRPAIIALIKKYMDNN
ncbi:GNAT family N-acetyltransferase [Paraflavitalea soli]|uniref:GNAT family N-acetyltransferase n=1 Tax=Paraflavitalea soli TaxID=2315862 RepID=A0A3B7MGA2_9BACT|nr:GNAT family N-acetyltransferase [Paraflavitalea soli]AXY73298.1 GNAT family N-acetyltransferase [Paraflavitalea soli]